MAMRNLGLLILRLTVGTFMAGHGTQKLFGWFSGPGLKGTHGFMESLGMKPGHVWGTMAALTETSGGLLTMLGFLNPLGPMNITAAMAVAIRRVHWNKPIWNMQGGAEFPLTNMAAALTLALTGPGRYSVDNAQGIRLPRWLAALAWIGTLSTIYTALQRPEVAERVVNKVSQTMPGSSAPTETPGLEVETRPRATTEQTSPA
jgi:putative oxidoreductase